MTEETPARRGANVYLVASVIAQVAALLRYVILARLLGPQQLGLVATLVVTATFFDLVSDTGCDRFLIQDRDGEAPDVQSLVHLVFVGRGALIAAALVVFAIPVSAFYGARSLAPALAVLALAPLIGGFLHFDVKRSQRRLDFRSEAVSLIAAEGASLVATLCAAFITRNFTAIIFGLVARSAMQVLVSHVRRDRPYQLTWSPRHGARLMKFATPLMLNGLMLFIGSQGDRVIVANRLGVEALGRYSVVLLLIYYPSSILIRYVHAMYVPMIAARRDDPRDQDRVTELLGGQTLLLALAMAVGYAAVAPTMITLLYGARFTLPALTIGLVGILQTARFLINWPTTAALGMGRSRTVLASNLTRILVFPGALVGLGLVGGLAGVLAGFTLGELVAVATSLALVNRIRERAPFAGFSRLALFVGASGLILGWIWALGARSVEAQAALLVLTSLLAFVVARHEAATLEDLLAMARQFARLRLFQMKAP